MNPELKKIQRIRDVLFISVLLIYGIFTTITAYSIANNVFVLEILLMRLTCVVLILVIYFLALKIIKAHEGCLRKINI